MEKFGTLGEFKVESSEFLKPLSLRWATETSRQEGQRKNTATTRRMIMETQRRKFRQRRIPIIFDLRPEEEHDDGEENKLRRRRRLAVRFLRGSHFCSSDTE